MADNLNFDEATQGAENLKENLGFILDAITSIGATLSEAINTAIDEAQGLDTVGKKINKTYARDVANGIKKLSTSLDKTFEINQKILESTDAASQIQKERIKQQTLIETIETRIAVLRANGIPISEEETSELNKQKQLSAEILADLEAKNDAMQTAGGLTSDALKGIEGILTKAGFGSLAKKLDFNGAIAGATTLKKGANGTYKATVNTAKAFKTVGANIIGAISPMDLLVAGLMKLFEASKAADKNIANLRRNFGLSFNESQKMNDQFAGTAIRTSDVTANVESLTEANQNINNQLGIQVRYQDDLLVTTNALVKRNKLSADAAAGFASQVLATGKNAENLLDISAQTVAEIQNQTGVQMSFNSILETANKTTGQLRANLMRTPDGLVKAVATAKSLGVEMKDIAGIAGTLLDFESSITKELEAELLIGKDLNLEQARTLALQGKSDEAVASLVEQMGSMEEFQSMNVLQQQALAEAVGMTADQLATTLEKQAAINSQKQDGLDIDAESMKEGASALSIQEQLSSAVTKLNSILQSTSVIVTALIGAAAGFLAGGPIGALIGLIGGATVGAATIATVQDGVADSSRGPFTITDSFGKTAITANGDGVAVSPNINVTSQNPPPPQVIVDNTEAKETNMLLKQILTKQGTVKMDSVDVGTAFSMNTYEVQ